VAFGAIQGSFSGQKIPILCITLALMIKTMRERERVCVCVVSYDFFRMQDLTLNFGGVWILATGLKETGCGVKETKKWASTSNCSRHAEVCNYSWLCSRYYYNILFSFVKQRYPIDYRRPIIGSNYLFTR